MWGVCDNDRVKEHHEKVYKLEQEKGRLEEDYGKHMREIGEGRSDIEQNYRRGIEEFEHVEWMQPFWSRDIVEQFSEGLDWDEKRKLDNEYREEVEGIDQKRSKLMSEHGKRLQEIDQQIDDLDMGYLGSKKCVIEEDEFGSKSWYPAGVL